MSRLHAICDWLKLARNARFRAACLAEACGVSLRQLERFILRTVGKTPQQWLNALRQCEAITLLKQGKPIKEITYLLGYRQPSHFSREFKRVHGMCPSAMIRIQFSEADVAQGYEVSPVDKHCVLNANWTWVSVKTDEGSGFTQGSGSSHTLAIDSTSITKSGTESRQASKASAHEASSSIEG